MSDAASLSPGARGRGGLELGDDALERLISLWGGVEVAVVRPMGRPATVFSAGAVGRRLSFTVDPSSEARDGGAHRATRKVRVYRSGHDEATRTRRTLYAWAHSTYRNPPPAEARAQYTY